jgi:tetratricopeptide (TPR) repeat protein
MNEVFVGDSIPGKINEGLRNSDYLILLMSQASMRSRWVTREWLPVAYRETESARKMILPVLVEDCDIPALLVDKRYADLRGEYLYGLSDIVAAMSEDLIAQHWAICFDAAPPQKELANLFRAILDHAQERSDREVVPLLRTLMASASRRTVPQPEWLIGEWLSTNGWSKNSVLLFTRHLHLVPFGPDEGLASENLSYGLAVASFRQVAKHGYLVETRELLDGLVFFEWEQPVGGLMGPRFDRGSGFLIANRERSCLRGLWWYDPHRTIHRTGDQGLRAFLWDIERSVPGEATTQTADDVNLLQRSLSVQEETLGKVHPHVALSIDGLAQVYASRKMYREAEALLKRSLTIYQRIKGGSSWVAESLENLAATLRIQGKYAEAAEHLHRALSIYEGARRWRWADVALTLDRLAGLYEKDGQVSDAEMLYKRAVSVCEKHLRPVTDILAATLEHYSSLLSAMNRDSEAKQLRSRASTLRARLVEEQVIGTLSSEARGPRSVLAALHDALK